MKPIGGYFGLEMRVGKEFHSNAIGLNSGRRCLEYILRANKYSKIYIPYYICNSIVETVKKVGIDYVYYKISENFFPKIDFRSINKNHALLYVNYFGINDNNVKKIIRFKDNIIIDNSQAFFSKQIDGINTFYSPRKFFGVPDGGYLYTNKLIGLKFRRSYSADRFKHLILRIDRNPKEGYCFFLKNEIFFKNESIKLMSNATKYILQSLDYIYILQKRNSNFAYYHKYLSDINDIKINFRIEGGPLVYPFLCKKPGLRDYLVNHNIYIPEYWKEVLDRVKKSYFEYSLTKNLVPLPLDQRYSQKELKFVIDKIYHFID